MKGAKRKPTKLKILEGEQHKDRINTNEPEPEPNVPVCPSHLSKEAKKEWKYITDELEQLGLISKIDRTALAAYCQVYGRWVKAEELLKNEDFIDVSPKGYPMQNPLITIANRAMELAHKFLVEFGMTPAARSRIIVNPTNKNNGKDRLKSMLG